MSSKCTKKGTRSQGRKTAVVIPPIPELHEHANAIRSLARRSFDDIVEIGRRLTCCRKLLKNDRVWMAWLSAEFSWSRRTADRLIDLFQAKDKVRKLRSLGVPVSALYELVKASPKLVRKIEQDIEAGERPSLRDIQHQARAERAAITITSPEPGSPRPMLTIAPQEEPTEPRRMITAEDMKEPFDRLRAGLALRQLVTFWAWFDGVPPDKFTAMLPASQHKQLRQVLHAIIALSNSHLEKLWEAGKPRLVSDEGDGR